jgi:predicted metal-binding protein
MLKIEFNPKILTSYFDNHVREMCKDCKRYNISASCPPFIESLIHYKNFLPTYKLGILVIKKFIIDDIKNWKELGINSSEEIRKELIGLKESLNPTEYDYFGAGSCKNCKQCSFPCRFPNEQLIPIEGTGINVIKLVKDITDIELKFPIEQYGYFYRIGIFLYD